MSLIAELCALGRRYLADIEAEFAEAVCSGDLERADAVVGEAARLSAALERQEAAGK